MDVVFLAFCKLNTYDVLLFLLQPAKTMFLVFSRTPSLMLDWRKRERHMSID